MSNTLEELKKFIIDNGVIGATAGFIIALSTKDLILSLVSDIIVPLIISFSLYFNFKGIHRIMSSGNARFDYINFLKLFITWVITLIITYYFIKITFQSFLGISIFTENGLDKIEIK